MGKVNFFNTETGQREQQMDTRGKYTLSIAYVSAFSVGLLLSARLSCHVFSCCLLL
jgi:hypothetical protein